MSGVAAGADRILDPLNPEQREVATTLLGPVRVLAGAGTGKTTAITHRIAYGVASGVYDPKSVMALTFTTRAAAQLRARLGALGVPAVSARTFHSAALAQLRYFWPQVFGGRMPSLVESKLSVLREAAGLAGVDLGAASGRDLASAIEWRKVRNMSIDDYAASGRATPAGFAPEAVYEMMRRYESIKVERRVMDFEDVLLATLGILTNEPTVAAQVHALYRVFVVDEYQDVSPVQQQLLEAWLGKRRELCVVGDVSQTIYTFAGASSRFLTDFDRTFPGAAHIEMVRNYRSTAPIVAAANRVIRGEPGAVTLVSETSGPDPVVAEFENDDDEARWVAESIAARIAAGEPADSFAVLGRLTTQLAPIEAALGRVGVPYRLRNSPPFFARPEVQKALLMLNAEAAQTRTAPKPFLHQVVDVLRELGYSAQPPAEPGAVRDAWEALAALLRMAEAMPTGTSLAEFVAVLGEKRTNQAEPSMRAVTVSTIHAAKGLEWNEVFVIGLADGILPFSLASEPTAIAEERRLFYVAVTRARHHVAVTWPAADITGRRRSPSPFLDGFSGARR